MIIKVQESFHKQSLLTDARSDLPMWAIQLYQFVQKATIIHLHFCIYFRSISRQTTYFKLNSFFSQSFIYPGEVLGICQFLN